MHGHVMRDESMEITEDSVRQLAQHNAMYAAALREAETVYEPMFYLVNGKVVVGRVVSEHELKPFEEEKNEKI